jgi:hypothetical protein
MIGLPTQQLQHAKLKSEPFNFDFLNQTANMVNENTAHNEKVDAANRQYIVDALNKVDNATLVIENLNLAKNQAIQGVQNEMIETLKKQSEQKGLSKLFHQPISTEEIVKINSKVAAVNANIAGLKRIEQWAGEAQAQSKVNPDIDSVAVDQALEEFRKSGNISGYLKGDNGQNPFLKYKPISLSEVAKQVPQNAKIAESNLTDIGGATYKNTSMGFNASPSASHDVLLDIYKTNKRVQPTLKSFVSSAENNKFRIVDDKNSTDQSPTFIDKTKDQIESDYFNLTPDQKALYVNDQGLKPQELYFAVKANQYEGMHPKSNEAERLTPTFGAESKPIKSGVITTAAGNSGVATIGQPYTTDPTVGNKNTYIRYLDEATNQYVRFPYRKNMGEYTTTAVNRTDGYRILASKEPKQKDVPLLDSKGEPILKVDGENIPMDGRKIKFGTEDKYHSIQEAKNMILNDASLIEEGVSYKTLSGMEGTVDIATKNLPAEKQELIQYAESDSDYDRWENKLGTNKPYVSKEQPKDKGQNKQWTTLNVTQNEFNEALEAMNKGRKNKLTPADYLRELSKKNTKVNIIK